MEQFNPEPTGGQESTKDTAGEKSAESSIDFGERIENTGPEPDEPVAHDEFGVPFFHEHDEFAEWLARDSD